LVEGNEITKMSDHPFQQRFIAFADTLGFRSICGRTSSEDRLFAIIREALKTPDYQSRHFQRYCQHLEDRRETVLLH
jgi:hypothetical protein